MAREWSYFQRVQTEIFSNECAVDEIDDAFRELSDYINPEESELEDNRHYAQEVSVRIAFELKELG